jgi:DNA polymerase elongation subunit (family B)
MVMRFGNEEPIYKFSGRSHLDYMKLFQKFTFEGRSSYALGNILQEEVGMGKLEYEGSLEQLYNNDFATFVIYNFRDVSGLQQLDNKFKFMALANQMAHENTVVFDAVLGTVAYVETGIANHAHYKLNKIVSDKVISEHEKVEGAIVMTPKIGMHEWIGSVDINSLYPNTIRSLNISPEKIIGQFTAKEDAWRDIWAGSEQSYTLEFEDGSAEMGTGAEWKQILQEQKWAISAYGTVFDQSGERGVVADILGFWYAERKRLQAEKKKWGNKIKELKKQTLAKLSPEQKIIAGECFADDAGNVFTAEVWNELQAAIKQEEHYDLLQLTKKISMNSLYGSLLNVAFRFGDERMGASVTATGRAITTHMIETLGELLTGKREPLIKASELDEDGKYVHTYSTPSSAIIYGDTDSVDKDSVVDTSIGKSSIESVFDAFNIKKRTNENREFAFNSSEVTTPCYVNEKIEHRPILAIYRHKVTKKKFKITLANGKSVIVTEDHSVMVMRDGVLTEVKPKDINRDTDFGISIKDAK